MLVLNSPDRDSNGALCSIFGRLPNHVIYIKRGFPPLTQSHIHLLIFFRSKHFVTPTMPPNYSLYSIPAYWFLALVPHAYAVWFPFPLRQGPNSELIPHADWRSQKCQQRRLGQHQPPQHHLPDGESA